MTTASWSGTSGGVKMSYVLDYTVTNANSTTTVKLNSLKVTNADATSDIATIWIGTKQSLSDGTFYDNTPYSGKTFRSAKAGRTTTLGASYTYARKTFAYTITISYIGQIDKDISIAIPALPSYAVTFNANNGAGAPAAQKKFYGVTLKLSSTQPTRSGYRFVGWNTAAAGTGTAYASGANYTGNAALTLYAQWKMLPVVDSVSVQRVNAAGNEDQMGAYLKCTATWRSDSTLAGVQMTFACGSASATATISGTSGTATATVAASARADTAYTVTATVKDSANCTGSKSATSTTSYSKPVVLSVLSVRTDANGVMADEGTWVRVDVTWQCAHVGSQGHPSLLAVAAMAGGSSYSRSTATFSGYSVSGDVAIGQASFLLGNTSAAEGPFELDENYTVTVTLSDTLNSATRTDVVTTAFFTFDVLGDAYWDEGTQTGERPGHGISFGSAAKHEGFNVSMPPYCYERPWLPLFYFQSPPQASELPVRPCAVICGDYDIYLYE